MTVVIFSEKKALLFSSRKYEDTVCYPWWSIFMRMIGFNSWAGIIGEVIAGMLHLRGFLWKFSCANHYNKYKLGVVAKNVKDQQMARLIRVNIMREWQGIVDIIGWWPPQFNDSSHLYSGSLLNGHNNIRGLGNYLLIVGLTRATHSNCSTSVKY